MLLGLIIQLVWKMFYPVSVANILICMFSYLSYGIAEYFCVEGTLDDGIKIEHGVRGSDGKITMSSCNLLVIAGVAIMCMGFMPLSITDESWLIILETPEQSVLLVLMFIFDVIIVIRQYRDMLNTVCEYEAEIQLEK